MNRRGAADRVDQNHLDCVQALLRCGYSVQSIAGVGNGCPDLIIGAEGLNLLLEIKNGDNPPSRKALTAAEALFKKNWKGQVAVVDNPAGAIAAVELVLVRAGKGSTQVAEPAPAFDWE